MPAMAMEEWCFKLTAMGVAYDHCRIGPVQITQDLCLMSIRDFNINVRIFVLAVRVKKN
jgi:hypothetical protein